MHRHGGQPLSRPELAAMYDAFETPRAVRGDLPLLDRAEALAYLADVRERALGSLGANGSDEVVPELVLRHEHQHGETMLQAIELARLTPAPAVPRVPRPAAPGGHSGLEPVAVPAGPCALGAPATGFSYDNERPRHHADAARLPDRPHADHQRDVPELRRGRRLRAPPVVERRGVGVEGGVRHHPPRGLGPRVRCEWRRWTMDGWAPLDPDEPVVHVSWFEADALARSFGAAAAHRGGVGEGGDLGPGDGTGPRLPLGRRAAPDPAPANLDHGLLGPAPVGAYPGGRFAMRRAGHARRRVGVDVDRLPRLPGFVAHPVPRVLRGVLRRRLQGAAGRLVGDARRASRRRRSATGTCPYRRQIFAGVRLAWDA